MTQTEALKLALEALEWDYVGDKHQRKQGEAITAIKEALSSEAMKAQPAVTESHKQEPASTEFIKELENRGRELKRCTGYALFGDYMFEAARKIKNTTPQRKPLTDEQIDFLNFLYGAGEWDGAWFEGKHPTKKGAFWWRKDMRRLFDYNNKEKS